ncbi:unnamed protein product, partial [Mesorhabditis belari]|uniref:glutathione transferase n=1 Tax=Mesorhabditis belari TaxID=2138241 RepID=A0AAF3EY40_9BILA
MTHYKLTYFDVRAKAEFIRQLFTLAGVDFEDNRIPAGSDEWPELKKKMTYERVPVLEFDGKQLAQANAIAKYIAAEHGFNGSNAWEAALIDSVGTHYEDLFNACRAFYLGWLKLNNLTLEDAYKNSVVPARDAFYPPICKFLRESKSGFIIGDKPSWVDLLVADHSETFVRYNPDYLKDYPEAKAHLEKVHSLPAIKKWIEKRPNREI